MERRDQHAHVRRRRANSSSKDGITCSIRLRNCSGTCCPLQPGSRNRSTGRPAGTSAVPTHRRSGRGPAGQCSIRGVNSMPSSPHSARSCASGARRNSPASMTAGARGAAATHVLEDLALLQHPDVGRHGVRAALEVRDQYAARVTDQEHVGELRQPVAADVRQQVMGHVLLVHQRRAGSRRRSQASGDACASPCRPRRSPARVPGGPGLCAAR